MLKVEHVEQILNLLDQVGQGVWVPDAVVDRLGHAASELLVHLLNENLVHIDAEVVVEFQLLVLIVVLQTQPPSELYVPRQTPAYEVVSEEHQTLKVVLEPGLVALETPAGTKHQVADVRVIDFV